MYDYAFSGLFFFFKKVTATGATYLDTLRNWSIPQLERQQSGNFIFQPDGVHYPRPPSPVGTYPFVGTRAKSIHNGWIGRQGTGDMALRHWPPRSPDIEPP